MTAGDLGPVTDASGRVLDQIRLVGVTARGRHGVLPEERRDGQDFTVDVVLHLDTARAAATDDLTATVHYGELAARIADVVRGEPVDLIETLAARIAAVCLAPPPVEAADVVVHKPHAPIAETFADVVVAIRRSRERGRGVPAVLALGANLGDRAETLRSARDALAGADGITLDAVSPVFETPPVGGPDQPEYYNAVALVTTTLSPRDLLRTTQGIEAAHGRERTVRWGPRTLDVDVIRYGDVLSDDPELQLPHPRAHERAFVLAPWLAVDPQAWLPGEDGGRSVAELLARAPDRDDVRQVS